MGTTDEEIFCFGKLLRQRWGSRPFTAIREGCSRRPCGSETTDNRGSTTDAGTKVRKFGCPVYLHAIMFAQFDNIDRGVTSVS